MLVQLHHRKIMKNIIASTLLWVCILLAVVVLTACLSADAKDSDDSVVWKASRGYRKRVESFKIKPDDASKLVLEQLKKPGTFKLKSGGILGEGTFIVGRWYWFGTATKTEIYIAGYYVNGDTGKIEYRESDKVLKSDVKHLPKDA